MLRAEVIDAMLQAGCTAEQIAAAVKAAIAADSAAEEARKESKRAGNAERQRRLRNARNALSRVTERYERDEALPPHPPQKVSPEPPSKTPPYSDPKGSSLPPGVREPREPEIEVRERIVEAFFAAGRLPPPMYAVAGWVSKGYAPDMIVDVVTAGIKRGVKSLSYFDEPLAREYARMLSEQARPPPEIVTPSASTVTVLRSKNEPVPTVSIGREIAANPPPGFT